MVNWNDVLSNKKQSAVVQKWAVGEVPTRQLRSTFSGTSVSGEVRGMLNRYGTTYGRRVCRKALRRRGLLS